MRLFLFLVLCFTPAHYLIAGSSDVDLQYDKISIGFIPSRGESFSGQPYKTIEARSLTHHKNKKIASFYKSLSDIAAEGITDNATQFHQPTRYLEAVYQGQNIRLFYTGDTGQEKYKNYEDLWKLLHREMYDYITIHLTPIEKAGQFRE